jgi:uncharacterized membrane protein
MSNDHTFSGFMKHLIKNFVTGWMYFIIGLVISFIMSKYILPNYTPQNSSDETLLKVCIIRMSFIIVVYILLIKLINILPIPDGIPFSLINIGIFMTILNLSKDIRYLVNKYYIQEEQPES